MIKYQKAFPVYPPRLPAGKQASFFYPILQETLYSVRCSQLDKALKPPLMIQGKENIPLKGPFLLVINHFYRPKYKAWWSVLAASALIPVGYSLGDDCCLDFS